MDRLTDKQEKFVQELIKGKTQREAYKIAYGASKMKENTIDRKASELMNNGKIRARYNELKNKVIKRAEEECIVTATEVLSELKRIGFADIKDFLSFKTAKTVVGTDDETGEPIIDFKQIIDILDSDEIDGRAIQEISMSAKGTFSFKLHDKMNALEKLGRYLGMYQNKQEIEIKEMPQIIICRGDEH